MIIRLSSILLLASIFFIHADEPCTFKPGECKRLHGTCYLTADCSKSKDHPGIKDGQKIQGICLQKSPKDAELVCKDLV